MLWFKLPKPFPRAYELPVGYDASDPKFPRVQIQLLGVIFLPTSEYRFSVALLLSFYESHARNVKHTTAFARTRGPGRGSSSAVIR